MPTERQLIVSKSVAYIIENDPYNLRRQRVLEVIDAQGFGTAYYRKLELSSPAFSRLVNEICDQVMTRQLHAQEAARQGNEHADKFSVGGITLIASEMDDPAPIPEPNTKKCIGCGQVRPMNPAKGGFVECAYCGYSQTPSASFPKHFGIGEKPTQVITLTIDPNAQGETGETGIPNTNVVVIEEPYRSEREEREHQDHLNALEQEEPDPSDDDTQELAPVRPEPLKTTFDLYGKPEEDDLNTPYPIGFFANVAAQMAIREQYKLAWRYQRRVAKWTDDNTLPDEEQLPYIGDVPIDLVLMARQSLVARSTPQQEPFIVRAWYKRLVAAQKALSTIPLDDNAGFNNAVLDFKLMKARYMTIAERWNHA